MSCRSEQTIKDIIYVLTRCRLALQECPVHREYANDPTILAAMLNAYYLDFVGRCMPEE